MQLAVKSGVGVRFISELERGKEGIQLGKALTVLAIPKLEIIFYKY
ncbi:hypothetical protein [Caulobacter sp. S45]